MDIGMVGLGRMGANMGRRLLKAGHRVCGYDADPQAAEILASRGGKTTPSLEALVRALAPPRVIWMMLPDREVGGTLSALAPLLEAGDCVVDGGNTFYQDTIRHAQTLGLLGLSLVDAGVSGGVWGRERGYCLMVGGEPAAVQRLEPLFVALTAGGDRAGAGAERGFLHCGPAGAGHFVKMVHNGIEYGMMAALAEGFDILRSAGFARREPAGPGIDPAHYSYEFDLADIAEVWRHGSVISSWLLDLSAMSLLLDPELRDFSDRVPDSGAGRWALKAALDEGVPSPVLSAALAQRLASRDGDAFARRLLSALRYQFGGHVPGPRPASGS